MKKSSLEKNFKNAEKKQTELDENIEILKNLDKKANTKIYNTTFKKKLYREGREPFLNYLLAKEFIDTDKTPSSAEVDDDIINTLLEEIEKTNDLIDIEINNLKKIKSDEELKILDEQYKIKNENEKYKDEKKLFDDLKQANDNLIEKFNITKVFMGEIKEIISKYRESLIYNSENNILNQLTTENIDNITDEYIKDLLTLYNIFYKKMYLNGVRDIAIKYNIFNDAYNSITLNERKYINFENPTAENIFERIKVTIKDINNENDKQSIKVLDNTNYNSIFQLKDDLVRISDTKKVDNFIEVYNKYARQYSISLIDIGIQQTGGGYYPEYPYQPIQVNRKTAIYRFILPVIVFKAFRIILYKKLLKQNKNAFVFKNILTDISLSFALIMGLNVLGLAKIASLLFSDLLISVVLIYVVLYMYDCGDEKKKEYNINNIINTLVLAPFFVMYVK